MEADRSRVRGSTYAKKPPHSFTPRADRPLTQSAARAIVPVGTGKRLLELYKLILGPYVVDSKKSGEQYILPCLLCQSRKRDPSGNKFRIRCDGSYFCCFNAPKGTKNPRWVEHSWYQLFLYASRLAKRINRKDRLLETAGCADRMLYEQFSHVCYFYGDFIQEYRSQLRFRVSECGPECVRLIFWSHVLSAMLDIEGAPDERDEQYERYDPDEPKKLRESAQALTVMHQDITNPAASRCIENHCLTLLLLHGKRCFCKDCIDPDYYKYRSRQVEWLCGVSP